MVKISGRPVPIDLGSAVMVHMTKSQSDHMRVHITVALENPVVFGGAPRDILCTCRGFYVHKHCFHSDHMVNELIAKGWLRPEEPICTCPRFKDKEGFYLTERTCPVHGPKGTDPRPPRWRDESERYRELHMAADTLRPPLLCPDCLKPLGDAEHHCEAAPVTPTSLACPGPAPPGTAHNPADSVCPECYDPDDRDDRRQITHYVGDDCPGGHEDELVQPHFPEGGYDPDEVWAPEESDE